MATDIWFKLNCNWMESPWVWPMSPAARLALVQLIGYAKSHGRAGVVKAKRPEVFALQNNLPVEAVEEMLAAAYKDMAVIEKDGEWVFTGWKAHQSGDETNAERQARWRAKKNAEKADAESNADPCDSDDDNSDVTAVTANNALRNARGEESNKREDKTTPVVVVVSNPAQAREGSDRAPKGTPLGTHDADCHDLAVIDEPPWWDSPDSRSSPECREFARRIASSKLRDGSKPFGPDLIPEHVCQVLVAEVRTAQPDWSAVLLELDKFVGSFAVQKQPRSTPLALFRADWLPNIRGRKLSLGPDPMAQVNAKPAFTDVISTVYERMGEVGS